MERWIVRPERVEYAFANALMGQRGCILPGETYEPSPLEPYVRLVKCYFHWNELERHRGDTVAHIREVTDARFAHSSKHDIRFIPRVALQWPDHGDHTLATCIRSYFPSDMAPTTLDSPAFFSRLRDFVAKLGEAWDLDPRVAYVETGIYGLWGEQHEDAMSRVAQQVVAESFRAAFPNTPCMVRHPLDCLGQGFGMYWDSFAHADQEDHAQDALKHMDWRTSVMGGEVAHNWGNHRLQPGDDMNDTLTAPDHLPRFLDLVQTQHNNHLGMWLKDDARLPGALAGLAEYQKRAGYRFVPESVSCTVQEDMLSVSVSVTNKGSSPLYHNWPLAAALLDLNRNPVWQEVFPQTDLRGWLPGTHWDSVRQAYLQPPRTHEANVKFSIAGVPEGSYYLALGVLDPSTGRPGLRLATAQHFHGGWHPMGMVGIRQAITDFRIPSECFDDMRDEDMKTV